MEINSVVDKVKKGFTKVENGELHQVGKIAFFHVKQHLYRTDRPNGKGDHDFNLIHICMEIEIEVVTWLSLDYQVAVFFERPTTDFTHSEILTKVIKRLTKMNIQLGSGMAKPIFPAKKRKSIR